MHTRNSHTASSLISGGVIRECLKNLQEDYPHHAGAVELLLDIMQADMTVPARDDIKKAAVFTVPKDVRLVAAAIVSKCSHLLTFDRADLINPPEVAEKSGLIILTPGDLLQ